jgi:hypothetical protein
VRLDDAREGLDSLRRGQDLGGLARTSLVQGGEGARPLVGTRPRPASVEGREQGAGTWVIRDGFVCRLRLAPSGFDIADTPGQEGAFEMLAATRRRSRDSRARRTNSIAIPIEATASTPPTSFGRRRARNQARAVAPGGCARTGSCASSRPRSSARSPALA